MYGDTQIVPNEKGLEEINELSLFQQALLDNVLERYEEIECEAQEENDESR